MVQLIRQARYLCIAFPGHDSLFEQYHFLAQWLVKHVGRESELSTSLSTALDRAIGWFEEEGEGKEEGGSSYQHSVERIKSLESQAAPSAEACLDLILHSLHFSLGQEKVWDFSGNQKAAFKAFLFVTHAISASQEEGGGNSAMLRAKIVQLKASLESYRREKEGDENPLFPNEGWLHFVENAV